MDEFLENMYNVIKSSIDLNDEDSILFIDDLKYKLEDKKYRWAFLCIDKFRVKHKIEIAESILEKFWWDYAN